MQAVRPVLAANTMRTPVTSLILIAALSVPAGSLAFEKPTTGGRPIFRTRLCSIDDGRTGQACSPA